jgi:hypothetical protein
MLAALAAGLFPPCFLLATVTCHPSPLWDYIYAVFFHTGHFTLKMEAVRTSEMLVSYHLTTWHHNQVDLNTK